MRCPASWALLLESIEARGGRYSGLRSRVLLPLSPESTGLLVKPDVARRQMDEEESEAIASGGRTVGSGSAAMRAASPTR
jgi:hypothetical protein